MTDYESCIRVWFWIVIIFITIVTEIKSNLIADRHSYQVSTKSKCPEKFLGKSTGVFEEKGPYR